MKTQYYHFPWQVMMLIWKIIELCGVHYVLKWNDGREFTCENRRLYYYVPSGKNHRWSFSKDGEFNADWDYVEGSNNFWGEVNATVDQNSWVLLDFDFKTGWREMDTSGTYDGEMKYRITGINFPLEKRPGSLYGKVAGQEIYQYINLFEELYIRVDPDEDQKFGFYYDDLTVNDKSYLEIAFYDEN